MERDNFKLVKRITEMFKTRRRGKRKDHYDPDKVRNVMFVNPCLRYFEIAVLPANSHSGAVSL